MRHLEPSAGVRASVLEFLHACPLCGVSRLDQYCRVPSLYSAGEFICYDRCIGCDVVFRNPRLPATTRIEGYRDRQVPASWKELSLRTQAHYRYLARRLLELQSPRTGGRLLDFGCGAGGFLVEAQRAGFDPFGLELNRDLARHVLATYGIPVHSGEIEDSDFPSDRFDVIVSFEVFEHLIDPRRVLQRLIDSLSPNGLLLIEVPNLHDFRERWRHGTTMDDSHLFYFNRRSLGRLLHSCGLGVIEVHEGLRPVRLLGEAAARLPTTAYRAFERTMASLQLKTALGVISAPIATSRHEGAT
jgi:SAM-dependent methyltransferase